MTFSNIEGNNVFDSKYQQTDWLELMKAIEEAPAAIECGSYPDLFFAEGNSFLSIREAKKFCTACPVVMQCATYAIKWEEEGIWGGLTARERAYYRNLKTGKSRDKRINKKPTYNRTGLSKASDQKAS